MSLASQSAVLFGLLLLAVSTSFGQAPSNMVLIPAGSFRMGSDFPDDPLAPAATNPDQRPAHNVQISAFYMDKYEVSRAVWDSVAVWAKTNGYDIDAIAVMHSNYLHPNYVTNLRPNPPDHPAVFLSWTDFVKWCNARSEMEGRPPAYKTNGVPYRTGIKLLPTCDFAGGGYRLPTEAEWEKAARGGLVGKRFPWGDTISHADANFYAFMDFFNKPYYSFDVSPTRKGHPLYNGVTWQWTNASETEGDDVVTGVQTYPYTAPVDAFSANGYGLHNMAGNVHEACWDFYDQSYYQTPAASRPDPRGPSKIPAGMFPEAFSRVIRGGAYLDNYGAAQCQVSFRSTSYQHPGFNGSEYIGFRSVLAAEPDLDGDGLRDDWETQGKGIDANGDGIIDLDLHSLGARPDRKDLFVEVDTQPFLQAAWSSTSQWAPFQLLIDAFAKAPVSNPNGTHGITLHILRSDSTVPPQTNIVRKGDFPPELVSTKAALLGTAAQRSDANSSNIMAALAVAFRYCTIYESMNHKANESYVGLAEFCGDDFVLDLDIAASGATPSRYHDGKDDNREIAGVFMHELGHTLGLHHGGSDRIQGKPNYPSVMNYALVAPLDRKFWKLDYSREGGSAQGGTIPLVGEDSGLPGNPGANEASGITSTLYRNYRMPIGVPVGSADPATATRKLATVKLDGSPVDFDGDGNIGQVPVRADVNFIGPGAGFSGVNAPSLGEAHEPHNDWMSLHYAVNPMATNSAGYEVSEGCPSPEVLDFLEANLPTLPVDEKMTQTLLFAQPDMQVFSPGGTFALSASSDSELPLQFISGDTNKIAISNNTATILGAGTVAITATNAGNDIFLPAAQTRTVTVAKASQTIGNFAPIDTQVFMPGKTLAIPLPTASSGLPVSLSVKSGPAKVSSNVVTFDDSGIVILAANQGGDDNHLPAPETTISFSVTGASPTPSPSPTPTASPTPSPTPTTSPAPSPTPGALWDEAVDGPLSASPQAPTPLSPAPEANFIYANVGGSAPEDYFTFTVAQGRTLASVTLTDYVPSEFEVVAAAVRTRSFALPTASIGLQSGSAWTAGDNTTLMLAQQQFGVDQLSGESMLLGISPLQPRGPGTYTVRIKQTEGQASYNIILYIDSDPLPEPVVTSPKNASGRVGAGFTYRIIADNGPQSFQVDTLPLGLNLNSQTGVISGTPTTAGTFFVILTATNTQGTGSSPLTLKIEPAVAITSGAFKAGSVVGKAFSYKITANNSPSTFQATGLPAGLKVNEATGVISGQPAKAGQFSVTVTANNAGTGTASSTLALTVAKGSQTITFNPRRTQAFKRNRTFTLSATATSDLGVSFTSSKPKVLSIKGNKATILRKGEVTITASQAGNANYRAAKPVPQTIRIR